MKAFLLIFLSSTAFALSPEEVQQYLSGAGMGYARPAELNSFPGPMHVLELADKLSLNADQRAATKRLMDEHKAEARAIGAKLVQAERALEALFRSGHVPPEKLAQAVSDAAAVQGQYRLSHLETHRRMRALLTEAQVKRYDELRGYGKGTQGHEHRHR
jgi:Spy/CpxP family protein refolding chaperone